MEYQFETKDFPATTILSLKATCGHHEIGAKLGEILPHVSRRAGHFMTGPPICLYHDWRESECDLEAGVPISGEPDLFGDAVVTEIPAHTSVTVIHSGGYDKLPEAHAAIMEWIAQHGKELAGSPWESYIDDPDDVGMVEARTIVGWPIK